MAGAAVGRRIDIKVGFNCNNRCRFCVQGNKRDLHGDRSTEEIKEILRETIKTIDSIVFTGGEVSIRADFLDLVAYAKEVGFEIIQIQTNGRMFANRDICRRAIEAGANEFSPALHGHIREMHDYLTQSPGSFAQTLRGIRNLKEMGQYVLTNSVINRSNYRHLPELAATLVNAGVNQYQFAFVHAAGTAGENFYSVVPRKTLAEPYVKAGLDIGIEAGRGVMTEAIPYCFMRGYEQYVAERIMPHTKIFDAEQTIDDYTEFRLKEGKAKGPMCPDCAMNDECEGPWREYPEKYGWGEFKPIKKNSSRQ